MEMETIGVISVADTKDLVPRQVPVSQWRDHSLCAVIRMSDGIKQKDALKAFCGPKLEWVNR